MLCLDVQFLTAVALLPPLTTTKPDIKVYHKLTEGHRITEGMANLCVLIILITKTFLVVSGLLFFCIMGVIILPRINKNLLVLNRP